MRNRLTTLFLTAFMAAGVAANDFDPQWSASTAVNAGSGDFAPYYIASNSGGIFTHPAGAYELASVWQKTRTDRRFSWGAGISAGVSITDGIDYSHYDAASGSWHENSRRAPYIWIQQLYAEVKFRGVFLTAGMKRNDRSIFDSPTGIGDITYSANSRPVPQVRIGFIDFQDIPFTRGWVQIQGEIAYGKFTDSSWLKDRFSYYDSFVTTGVWMHYKRCYFRTNPEQPFSVTVGMQHAAQFGGDYRGYSDGVLVRSVDSNVGFRDFIDVFIQKRGKTGVSDGDRQYYNGNHLGSWDFQARYRFTDGRALTAYFQWPWEDGSGIGKLNGWDGVWALEYTAPAGSKVTSASIVYFDFTNQSGPIHWAPDDHASTGIHDSATGADDYYNNYFYNGWQNYGMAMGTPMMKSPLYNRDGYLRFTDNRLRGFQAGVAGQALPSLSYRALISYRTSWGTPLIPSAEKHHDTSMLLEAVYSLPRVKGLALSARLSFDAGNLLGNNFGAMLGVEYTAPVLKRNRNVQAQD